MKILVVDDNLKSIQSLTSSIKKLGHYVDQCESAVKALNLWKKHNYQLIFTDIRMPGMSGVELLKVITTSTSKTKVVLITGYGELETAIEAVRYNAFDYLLKPIGIEQLVDVIERVSATLVEKEEIRSLNVLLYSRQLFLAEGICTTLRTEREINNINYVTAYADFIRRAEFGSFDLILLDADSIELERCNLIYLKYPHKKVIALTFCESGAIGNLSSIPVISLENCNHHDLLLKLKNFCDNKLTPPELSVNSKAITKLNDKEKEILLKVAQGKRNKEIAQELFLSHSTVRNYVSKILQKLGIPNRTAAALFASKYMLDKDT